MPQCFLYGIVPVVDVWFRGRDEENRSIRL